MRKYIRVYTPMARCYQIGGFTVTLFLYMLGGVQTIPIYFYSLRLVRLTSILAVKCIC